MHKYSRTQNGAALIVGLVLLLVLTLLAVSTMRTAALELLMAGNAQNRETAFRLAEAGIADAISRPVSGFPATDGWSTSFGPIALANPDVRGSYDADISYLGVSTLPSYGMYSVSDYEFVAFQIDATGRSDRGARSLQSQGVVRAVPRGPE